MAKINLVCESCGGNVVLDDMHEFGFCSFCKAKVLIKSDTIINEVTQNITKHVYGHEGKDVEELLLDANNLLKIGDEARANAKFKNAIDIESNSWDGWFGYAATGGDRSGYFSFVPAYRYAYSVAADENQQLATFTDVVRHLPDIYLRLAFDTAYKAAHPARRQEIFDLVLGVLGRDETESARLATDLCPNDWRAWFALAKIRQVRVRWCELEGNVIMGKRLPKDAVDVLNIFVHTYRLARWDSADARNVVLSHISAMTNDESYKNFARELNAQLAREG